MGDYRRVPLYGTDFLIEEKKKDLDALDGAMTDERIRLREEVQMQIRALQEMALMAKGYGCDIARPAETAHDAVQSLYMAYLAGVKENNGAATSLGRTATFLDIYIQRDLDNGTLDEAGAQELVDQFIIKLRLVRHLRTPEYNELFGGDPTWITESHGRHGHRRPHPGDPQHFPLSSHPHQSGHRSRAQPDRSVEPEPPRRLQALLRQNEH